MTSRGYLNMRNAVYAGDLAPLDPECSCFVCRSYSRAYIRHLFNAGEVLALRLATFHNLYYLQQLMRRIREAISAGRFEEFYARQKAVLDQYYGGA